MKESYSLLLTYLFFSFITSCIGQSNSTTNTHINKLPKNIKTQIGNYIVEIFEDSKGNLWFGTIENGVAKYDGKKLEYFTSNNGLPSNRVVQIIEDRNGFLWFGTGFGISRYDGNTFINFSENEGLCNNMVSNLFIDSNNTFWIGTWGGVCKFDGKKFTSFPLPYPKITTSINKDTKDWITEISEDSKGNIWFGRDGYGACKYDGLNFTHFTKTDGLPSNNVQDIIEDKQGNIWIGTRVSEKDLLDVNKRYGSGGLSKYNGKEFKSFPNVEGLHNNDVYQIYIDSKENLWISTINKGLYKYNGKSFINYPVIDPNNQTPKAIISMLEDNKGVLWIGCAGGLFQLNGTTIINITTEGPWN